MTDRVRTLTVLLEEDIRDDDVQNLVDVITMIRHVASVELGEPVDIEDRIARQNFALNQGHLIASLAVNSDPVFQQEVDAAYEAKQRRLRGQ